MEIPPSSAPPDPPPQGTCFGFEIHSDLGFEYLRPGSGRPTRVLASNPLETFGSTTRLQTWEDPHGVQATTRLHRCGPAAFGVELGEQLWFRYEENPDRFTVSSWEHAAFCEALLWGTPAAVAMVRRGDLVLHAASVEVDGAGILLSAPGGNGKTTLAAAFHGAGHRLLSDDLTCCRLGPRPALLPGPPLARLRPDSAERLDRAGTYVAWERPDRIYTAIEPATRGTADPVPLKRIVLLDPESKPLDLRPMSPGEAMRDLWGMSFWLPVEGSQARCFEDLGALLGRVPAIRLSRPRDWSALADTVAFVAAGLR